MEVKPSSAPLDSPLFGQIDEAADETFERSFYDRGRSPQHASVSGCVVVAAGKPGSRLRAWIKGKSCSILLTSGRANGG
jgi:hypothetical protein